MVRFLFSLLLLLATTIGYSQLINSGVGINKAETYVLPGEDKSELFADLNAQIVRHNVFWQNIEYAPGLFKWDHLDARVATILAANKRPFVILWGRHTDYTTEENGPATAAAREAYAKMFKAVVGRYRNKGIIWAPANEPNHKEFWTNPNPTAHADFLYVAAKAVKESYPQETIVGFSTAGIDFNFIEVGLQKGVYKYIDYVDIHPYSFTAEPELNKLRFEQLRQLINKYAAGYNVGIGVSEFGFKPESVRFEVSPNAGSVALINQPDLRKWNKIGNPTIQPAMSPDETMTAWQLIPNGTNKPGVSFKAPALVKSGMYVTTEVWARTSGPEVECSLGVWINGTNLGDRILVGPKWRQYLVTVPMSGSDQRVLKFAQEAGTATTIYLWKPNAWYVGPLTATEIRDYKEQRIADWLYRTLTVGKTFGLAYQLVYAFEDQDPNPEKAFGLVTMDGRIKPAYYAFKNWIRDNN
jgi:hypothetical protein